MPKEINIRQYIVMPMQDDQELYQAYRLENIYEALKGVERHLYSILPSLAGKFEVVALPTRNWKLMVKEVPEEARPLTELVISVEFHDEAVLIEFREAIRHIGAIVGADIAARQTEYWCPANVEQLIFGNRAAARQLIYAEELARQNLVGDGVNVVVVDRGLDERFLGANFRGGWSITNPYTHVLQMPGRTQGEDARHGMMMVRNILDAAPNASIYDFPLIPPRIWDISPFVADAQAAFQQLRHDIRFLGRWPQWTGPWVLVNAWAVFDRRSEHPAGDYTDNLAHPLNAEVTRAADDGLDLVFCAGNCGQFCPDQRCGPRDQGPGQSIFGANSHPRVISVGAVRVDAKWLGYSSQGPGQPNMALAGSLPPLRKPDFCAPSNFSETGDAYTANTGTSAACGVTAGVVAALRSRWAQAAVSPDVLRAILSLSARKTEGPGWNGRLGNGVLNVETALQVLDNVPA